MLDISPEGAEECQKYPPHLVGKETVWLHMSGVKHFTDFRRKVCESW